MIHSARARHDQSIERHAGAGANENRRSDFHVGHVDQPSSIADGHERLRRREVEQLAHGGARPLPSLRFQPLPERDEHENHRAVHQVHRLAMRKPVDDAGHERRTAAERDERIHIGGPMTSTTQRPLQERRAEQQLQCRCPE